MISRQGQRRTDEELRCSFCNKSQPDVQKLIAGPTVFICDECISVCQDILAEDAKGAAMMSDVELPQPLPKGSALGSPMPCILCGVVTPICDLVSIRNRGALCVGCIGEVEAAAAERRESRVHWERDL